MTQNNFQAIRIQLIGKAGWVIMNRPQVRNAFDERMIEEIHEAFRTFDVDSEVRVIVITGDGPAFSAGADINWMKRMGEAGFEANYTDALALAMMLDSIANCAKPTIARVNGPTIGGGSGIVAACDIAIADRDAFFSFSEVKIGLVPACIGPYVVRRVGPGAARELFISGRRIDAAEAERKGLVNFVAESGKLDLELEQILKSLVTSGPEAIKAAKNLVNNLPGQTREEYIEFTARLIAELRTSAEGREGTAAFLEKRKPKWIDSKKN